MDFSGITVDDERLDLGFFVFVPGKERLCSRTVLPSFLSYSLTWTGLSELEFFLDFDALLLEDRDEEDRPFCADKSSGRVRKTIRNAMAMRLIIVKTSMFLKSVWIIDNFADRSKKTGHGDCGDHEECQKALGLIRDLQADDTTNPASI